MHYQRRCRMSQRHHLRADAETAPKSQYPDGLVHALTIQMQCCLRFQSNRSTDVLRRALSHESRASYPHCCKWLRRVYL